MTGNYLEGTEKVAAFQSRRRRWMMLAFVPVLLTVPVVIGGVLLIARYPSLGEFTGSPAAVTVIDTIPFLFALWWLLCAFNLVDPSRHSGLTRGVLIVCFWIALGFLNLVAGAVILFAGCALVMTSGIH